MPVGGLGAEVEIGGDSCLSPFRNDACSSSLAQRSAAHRSSKRSTEDGMLSEDTTGQSNTPHAVRCCPTSATGAKIRAREPFCRPPAELLTDLNSMPLDVASAAPLTSQNRMCTCEDITRTLSLDTRNIDYIIYVHTLVQTGNRSSKCNQSSPWLPSKEAL